MRKRDDEIAVENEPSLYFGLMTEGNDSALRVNGRDKFKLQAMCPVLFAFGERTSCVGQQRLGARCASVAMTVSLDFVESLAKEYNAEVFWEILENVRNDVFLKNLPQNTQIHEIVHKMLENPFDGSLAGLHLESCTLALMVEIASTLINEKATAVSTDLTRQEIQRAHMVRDLLEENIVDPPSLSRLSREVGINPTTMSVHFRKVFGDSIFSYLRSRRLELARVMLRTQEIAIAQVGYRVGFSNPAAFATAYRKHFGHPPSCEGRRAH
ncbi:helix-turn-helix transcriptional regulator [Brucella pseudogrignonensis]|uniref:helix-turn-helix transcriptional regulator n=1 Tax=Brucella pseudogrignonensis TaxID=419475 RepID=UPI0038B56242